MFLSFSFSFFHLFILIPSSHIIAVDCHRVFPQFFCFYSLVFPQQWQTRCQLFYNGCLGLIMLSPSLLLFLQNPSPNSNLMQHKLLLSLLIHLKTDLHQTAVYQPLSIYLFDLSIHRVFLFLFGRSCRYLTETRGSRLG